MKHLTPILHAVVGGLLAWCILYPLGFRLQYRPQQYEKADLVIEHGYVHLVTPFSGWPAGAPRQDYFHHGQFHQLPSTNNGVLVFTVYVRKGDPL